MNEYDKLMDDICLKYPLKTIVVVRPPTSMMVDEHGKELVGSKLVNLHSVNRFEVDRGMAYERERSEQNTAVAAKTEKREVPIIKDYIIDGSKIETLEDVKAIFSVMDMKFRNPDDDTYKKLKHLFK